MCLGIGASVFPGGFHLLPPTQKLTFLFQVSWENLGDGRHGVTCIIAS